MAPVLRIASPCAITDTLWMHFLGQACEMAELTAGKASQILVLIKKQPQMYRTIITTWSWNGGSSTASSRFPYPTNSAPTLPRHNAYIPVQLQLTQLSKPFSSAPTSP